MKHNIIFLFLLLSFLAVRGDIPKMTRVNITQGVTALLPKDFEAMSDQDIAQKYPSTKKPLAMFTSLDRTVDFGLNVSKSSIGDKDLTILQKLYKATILDLYTNVQFSHESIETIHNRDYIAFEFTSQADQTQKYTYLQYTVIGDRVYLFNFTVGEEKKGMWQPIARAIMQSIKIDAKKLKEATTITQPVHKGKRPIEIIKQQQNPAKK